MNRHDFLHRLHEIYRPRTYFEIGVNTGQSLSLSRAPTVAVDPAFFVTAEIDCDLHLVRATSDAFFARTVPFDHLRGTPVDLAFIDGMHLFEFALRDFINTERFIRWTSVIVFDESGKALGGEPPENAELARHKLLDLMGDLYLFGGPMLGKLTAERPGHTATHCAIRTALERGIVEIR